MAKLESVENQETAWPVNTLPAESRSTALKPSVSPTARVALAGCTVTLATDAGAPVTWIVIESDKVPLVATMVAEPTALPVTLAVSPAPATSATAGLRLVHDTDGFGTGFPLLSPTAANHTMLPPTQTVVAPAMCK